MIVGDDGSLRLENTVGGTLDGVTMIQFPLGVGYVPTRAGSGARLRWPGSCVFVTPDAPGTTHIEGEGERAALQASMDAWNDAIGACGYLRLMMTEPEELEVGLDGKNVVKYREDRWCRPMNCRKPPECYSPSATAIATVCFINSGDRPDDGVILDVDIEVNAVDYAISTGCEDSCVTAGSGTRADLQNTLTHELGHLIGLDHTCWDRLPPGPQDHEGNVVPQCEPRSELPDAVVEATMFNFQGQGETSKRSLTEDDVAGACSAYPREQDPRLCEPTDLEPPGGCCSVAGGRGAGPPAGLLLASLAAAFLARGRRRRC
jgi:hypothetical protein